MARKQLEPGVLSLLNDAFHLLRQAPISASVVYFAGVLPFFLGFFYFWTDMSQSGLAPQHIGEASGIMALLYLWMCCWQTAFCEALRPSLTGQPPEPWTGRRIAALLKSQTLLQATALAVFPVSAATAILLPYAYGFYQHASAHPVTPGSTTWEVIRDSLAQIKRWQQQNLMLTLLGPLLGLFILMNYLVALLVLPGLLKMLTGWETVFTKAGSDSMMNSTVFLVAVGLTYATLDPLMRAAYLIRGFRSDAVQTGLDLSVELRRQIRGVAAAVVFGIALLSCSSGMLSAAPDQPAAAAPKPALNSAALNQAVDEVLRRPEYAWRMPRPVQESDHKNWFIKFSEDLMRALRRLVLRFFKLIGDALKWLEKLLLGHLPSAGTGHLPPAQALRGFLYVMLALALLVIGVVFWRQRHRWTKKVVEATPVVQATVDLAAEDLTADQLPEDGWLELARQWIEKQDFRMAARALYLASLAFLGRRELIRIDRGKSNREYARELARRSRLLPEVSPLFDEQVRTFEATWYGLHEMSREGFDAYRSILERMRACAEQ